MLIGFQVIELLLDRRHLSFLAVFEYFQDFLRKRIKILCICQYTIPYLIAFIEVFSYSWSVVSNTICEHAKHR